MKSQCFYKIRDVRTGLFSTGGLSPKFTKTGKTWQSFQALKLHLHVMKNFISYSMKPIKTHPYGDDIKYMELVKYDIVESEVNKLEDMIK